MGKELEGSGCGRGMTVGIEFERSGNSVGNEWEMSGK